MKKPQLENLIEQNFPYLGKVRVHSAKLNDEMSCCDIELLTTNLVEDESKICDFVSNLAKVDVKIKFIKNYFDFDFLLRKLMNFFQYDSILLKNKVREDMLEFRLEEEFCVITFLGSKSFTSYIQNMASTDILNYLYRSFIYEFKIESRITEEDVESEVSLVPMDFKRAVKVENLKSFIGKCEGEMPLFIIDIDDQYERVILAGKVCNLVEKIKKNPKPNRKGVVNPKYFSFDLVDPSAKIKAVMFPALSNNNKIMKMADKEVVVSGKISLGFSGEFEIMVKNVAFCDILSKEPPENLKVQLGEPKKYNLIFPQKVTTYTQDNLLEEAKKYDLSSFENKTIVVFDLETTGMFAGTDKIIEIGAVKVVNGKIIEKFSTLIDPQMHINDKASAVNHIYDKDVAGCPTYNDVVSDFYKFCYGSILCGHNIKGFDMKFVKAQSEELNFFFDHPVIDTLEISRLFVKGVANFKLGTLCERFNIVNENAHRAFEDAIANAEVLIAMVDEYKNIKI